MATYITKGFSLKYYGEELTKTMDSHFSAMDAIDEERKRLGNSFVGDMLRQKIEEINDKIRAQRERTIARINELEVAGQDGIDRIVKSGKPSDIVQNDLLLLDDGIFPVDQMIFERLADTYKDNFLMTQAICKYALEHGAESLEGSLSVKPKEGFVKFDLPMTVQQTRDLLNSSAALCRNTTLNSFSSGNAGLGYALTVSMGPIRAMIDMG